MEDRPPTLLFYYNTARNENRRRCVYERVEVYVSERYALLQTEVGEIHFNRTLLLRFGGQACGPSSCTLIHPYYVTRIPRLMLVKHIPSISVRTSLAASTLAGLSRFGVFEDRRDMTLIS